MRIKLIVLILFSGVPVLCGDAQFVEKRSKRGPSVSALKQACCEDLGDFLHAVGPCLVAVGELQERAVVAIQGYWQGDKCSFCERSSRAQLAAYKDRLCLLNEKIEGIVRECQACITALDEGSVTVLPMSKKSIH